MTDAIAPKPKTGGVWLAAVLSSLLTLAWAVHFHPAIIDDAFITFRYSVNWANGEGLTHNPGAVAVEGYTNFLWMLIGAVGARLGVMPHLLMPWIGAACAIATCVILSRSMRLLVPKSSRWWQAMPALLLAPNPLWGQWAVSGMETPLVALCVTGGVCSVLTRGGRAEWTTALWFFAAALARPDAALWGVVLGLWCMRVDPKRALVRFAIPFTVLFGAYWLWRWSYFDALMPNTFTNKQGVRLALFSLGLRYVGNGLIHAWPLIILAVVGLKSVDALRRRDTAVKFPSGLIAAASACAVVLVYVVWVGGDCFPADRFLMPVLPVVLICIAWLLAMTDAFHSARTRIVTVAFGFLCMSLAPLIGFTEGSVIPRLAGPSTVLHSHTRIAQWRWTLAGRWLDAHLPAGSSVALNPIGAVGYWAPEIQIVDMLGLTDPVIAHGEVRDPLGKPGHQRGSGERVLELDPDVILINNVWVQPLRLSESGWNPIYASETDLHERRMELLRTYEIFDRRIERSLWPDDLPPSALFDGEDELWFGALVRRGLEIQ